MTLRGRKGVALALAITLAPAAAVPHLAAAPARRTENVILVTTDGLRWQELFGGADEPLLTQRRRGGGRPRAAPRLLARHAGGAARGAAALLLVRGRAREGQVFGNLPRGSAARVTNGKNFSYPGYNELLSGRADPRIDSNDKKPNPNVTVLEWLNGRPAFRGQRRRLRLLGRLPLHPQPRAQRRARQRRLRAGPPGDGERIAMLNELMAETTPPEDSVRADSFTFLAALGLPAREQAARALPRPRRDRRLGARAAVTTSTCAPPTASTSTSRRLWESLQSMPEYQGKTSLVITTDHGRGDAADRPGGATARRSPAPRTSGSRCSAPTRRRGATARRSKR